jgi:hypothetical protein
MCKVLVLIPAPEKKKRPKQTNKQGEIQSYWILKSVGQLMEDLSCKSSIDHLKLSFSGWNLDVL